MARGEFVAFIDDDAVPDEDWLVDAIAAFDSEEVAGVGGFVYDTPSYELQYSYTVCDRMGNAYHNLASADGWSFVIRGVIDIRRCSGRIRSFAGKRCWRSADSMNSSTISWTRPMSTLRLIDAGYTLKQIPRAFVYHRYLPSHIRNEEACKHKLRCR